VFDSECLTEDYETAFACTNWDAGSLFRAATARGGAGGHARVFPAPLSRGG